MCYSLIYFIIISQSLSSSFYYYFKWLFNNKCCIIVKVPFHATVFITFLFFCCSYTKFMYTDAIFLCSLHNIYESFVSFDM